MEESDSDLEELNTIEDLLLEKLNSSPIIHLLAKSAFITGVKWRDANPDADLEEAFNYYKGETTRE